MKRLARRWLVIVLMLLVAGAIVNVAVAWECVIRLYVRKPTTPMKDSTPSEFTATWTALARPGWEAEPTSGVHMRRFGARQRMADAGHWTYTPAGGSPVSFARFLTYEKSAGWPMLALKSMGSLDNENPGWVIRGRLKLPWRSTRAQFIDVPWHPIWRGFAINTLFYAAILWLLLAGPLALRRRGRIKHGLCPKCAYDLRGRLDSTKACPECGGPLASPSR